MFYARYLFTGSLFLESEASSCGNMILFCLPHGDNVWNDHKLFFSILSPLNLSYVGSLEKNINDKMLGCLKKLRMYVNEGRLKINLFCEEISLSNVQVISDINLLK